MKRLFTKRELLKDIEKKLNSSAYYHFALRILNALYKDAYDVFIDSKTSRVGVELYKTNEQETQRNENQDNRH